MQNNSNRFWPNGWWKIVDYRIGIIPLPIYILLLVLTVGFVATGKVPSEISMSIAILAVGGFTCAEIGKYIPFFKNFGAAAILATFIPSYLAFNHVLPQGLIDNVTKFTTESKFLYLFISSIIVGSILGMDRTVLIKGFVKIFIPLAVGSVCAIAVGSLVGMAFGFGLQHTLLYIVLPVMAGGVGEGAIPLSVGYAGIFNPGATAEVLAKAQGEYFALVLPSIMMGSLTAILLSGVLNYVGKAKPSWTGEGRLQPGENDVDIAHVDDSDTVHVDVAGIAAAGITSITLYLGGVLLQKLTDLPAPVAMLFIAVVVKLTQAVSPKLEQGAFVVYKFFSTAVTYPLLFAIGVSSTPWDKLIQAFNLPQIITIVSTVVTIMTVGFFVGKSTGLYPIEAAIINATHSGQGGTGDVAILTAANRMQLMPFAQIATRIGGAITVTLTLIILGRMVG